MIVSSGKYGKICNGDGKFVPYHSFHPPYALEKAHVLPSKTPNLMKATSQLEATPTTPANFPSPTNLFEHPPTSQKKNSTPNALLPQAIMDEVMAGYASNVRLTSKQTRST